MVVEKGRTPAEPETKITILLDGSEGTSGCRIGGRNYTGDGDKPGGRAGEST